MTADRLRRLSASPWLEAAIAVTVIVATWAGEWPLARHGHAGVAAGLAILAILIGLPLPWRRQAPLAVLALVLAGGIGSSLLATAALGQPADGQGPVAVFLAVLLAVFSFGAYAGGRHVLIGGLLLVAGLGVSIVAGLVSGGAPTMAFGSLWASSG